MSTPLIQFDQINKSFDSRPVLSDLSFQIAPGELVALLGVNGAGKTTIINLMLGLEKADSGTIRVLDQQPGSLAMRRAVGVTPQNTDFPEGLKVKEILAFVAAHYPQPLSIATAIKQFSLTDIADSRANGLSYGQKRRLAVALAFMGQPKLIFLDEPTTGLDVQSRHALWQIIQNYIAQGGSMVLTTHYLEEAQKLASRVLFLDQGQIRSDGTVAEILANSGHPQVIFTAPSCPSNLSHAINIKQVGHQYHIETDNSDALIRQLVQADVAFDHLSIQQNSLETAFLNLNQQEANA